MNERDYTRGERDAYLAMLQECLRGLGKDGDAHRWRVERERAVAMLRTVCEHHGDNDWPDNLSLADIIDKHLMRHLEGG